MAFIDKKDPVVINIKLTTKGRELLSTGGLTFKYFAIGDSEIDYEFNNETGLIPFDSTILRPADKNPNLISFIPRDLGSDPYNPIPSIPASQYIVTNTAEPIGFFNVTTGGTATFITDSNHVKQPDMMIDVSGIAGGTQLTLMKAPTFGASGQEPQVGDLLLVKWTYDVPTTGHTINKTYPQPYLLYKIQNIISGSLAGDNLIVVVDRDLPDFTGLVSGTVYAGALAYYDYINFSGESVFTMSSTEYLDESVLSFLQNCQCPTVIFPFWNLTIIYTEEIAGVTADKLKYSDFKSKTYGGFVSYIQNQVPTYKKLGVIHYTNSSPANVYGEELYVSVPDKNIPTLHIPTIMWHKSTGATMGLKLTAVGGIKLLTGATTGSSLNTRYYDLADESGNVVGKVFHELKIFVIEDQELLFAMSYKANRNWTLPDYLAGTTEIITNCPPAAPVIKWTTPANTSTTGGIISSNQYCYKSACGNVGWTNFPVGGCHVVCDPIYCAGYRVYYGVPNGGGGVVWACDYENTCTICTYSTGSGPGTTITFTLSAVNYNNDYCFGGAVS
jgi:hypothetical protein